MSRALALAAGAAAFLIVATANSGGYRYGISDQAFYVPAVAHAADPSLFPRDSAILSVQTSKWLGDDVLGLLVRPASSDMPVLFAVLYAAGGLLLFASVVSVVRALGGSWWAVAGATALLTLRHRIAKTGANSLEGYMHPRMLAFAVGLIALGFMLKRRNVAATIAIAMAAAIHPTTALWFAGVFVLCLVSLGSRPASRAMRRALLPVLAVAGFLTVSFYGTAPVMTGAWLAVLDEKDYLFSHQWPAYAWILNLLYPAVIVAIYLRRKSLGVLAPGERRVVGGLIALVVVFLVSVPLAAAHLIPVVQLQANRVFWLLDAFALLYIAWWLLDHVATGTTVRTALVVGLALLACGRGAFILIDTGRAFVTFDLPRDDWTDAMRWLRTQPADWQVLADPEHAPKYGTSVRVAALRDTVLERSKDSAMAMYDSAVALRVSDRSIALGDFGNLTDEQFRQLGKRYDARVLVLERARTTQLPQLYANNRFAIYDLR
ncbi:MAG TPA: hypothetical protein VN700_05780 [Vicinamibacterales bacterium]|nr:hypothetical protein [Vicinamibacterales bacterium]